jgi:hypothetical protein
VLYRRSFICRRSFPVRYNLSRTTLSKLYLRVSRPCRCRCMIRETELAYPLVTANVRFRRCAIKTLRTRDGATAADLIVHSSGPPPIVLCNSLLENVLVSPSFGSVDANDLIKKLTWSPAIPARLRIDSTENDDADHGQTCILSCPPEAQR